MAEYKREDIAKAAKAIANGKVSSIYLIFGDRFLVRQVAEDLVSKLIPDPGQVKQNLKLVDGDKEDPLQTLHMLKTYSLFPGRQVVKVVDSKLFHPKGTAKSTGDGGGNESGGEGNDAAEMYLDAFSSGIPADNVLVVLAEEVDKRKRFYKFIKKHGTVFDLSVAKGSSGAAKKDQDRVLRDLVVSTLAGFGKKMENQAFPVFFERVGFYPVAVVREAEKLALYTEDAGIVTLKDVDEMVGRTREDALFEFTEAFSDKKITKALMIVARMMDAGVHPLVIVSGLRNHLRKLLLLCSFRKQAYPVYIDQMNFASFQKGYLVQLKEEKGELLKSLPNHPYALFMMFEKAKKYSVEQIMNGLKKLLEAEFRLKSSQLPGRLVLENFIFEMLAEERKG